MPQQFYGISALTRTTENTNSPQVNSSADIISVRVKDIILDDTHPKFKEYGEWNGVGTIFYDLVSLPFAEETVNVAQPLFSNLKFYPLINELVSLVFLSSTDTQTNTNITTAYYLPPINLWNSQHHNALPDSTLEPNSNSQQDYQNASEGVTQNVRRVYDNSTEIDLGKGFNEQINTHPLKFFAGDNLIEGRWGNSIRLGSYINNNNNVPSLTIRNGQPNNTSDEGWIPIVENINEDQSTISLIQNQSTLLEAASTSYSSYTTAPVGIKDYQENQIILNSGRLVFNTKSSDLLLSSNKSINLNSINSVNIDTQDLVVDSNNIYLGNKGANEPLLKGDVTVTQLRTIIDALNQFFSAYSKEPPNAKIASTPLAGAVVVPALNKAISILEKQGKGGAKSSHNFTI